MGFLIDDTHAPMNSQEGVLAPFRAEAKLPYHKLHLLSVEALAAPEGNCVFDGAGKSIYRNDREQIRYEGAYYGRWEDAYLRISRIGTESFVQLRKDVVARGVSPKTVLTAMELEHQIVCSRGFLFHSAYVRRDDHAILFTGPSGMGKSTQAELWQRLRGAELINGDRSIVRIVQGEAMVHGVPYSGSSGVSRNQSLPLKAIVSLSQAPRTTIQRLVGLRAFRELWEQCCINIWNRDDVDRCMQTVMQIIQNVPVYHLACTPDESAVTALESMLNE